MPLQWFFNYESHVPEYIGYFLFAIGASDMGYKRKSF
jgi:hypothetical protein